MQTIYFDYNATTPLDPQVREAMLPSLGEAWGNPSSVHHVGRRARALLDEARERAANALGAKPSEIVFTSGGTESANLAILGTARHLKASGRHIITSSIEHPAVLQACAYLAKWEGFEVTRLPVDHEGIVCPDSLIQAIRPDTILASVMAANNEIGTLQPVAELGAICREHGIAFHTDAVQWLGKEAFDNIHQFNADLVSVCAHKIHGPKGAGALFVRSPLKPEPLLLGGGHENDRRAGTENLAGILGLVSALEHFLRPPVFPKETLLLLTERLIQLIDRIPGAQFVGSRSHRLPNTVAFVVERTDSAALLAGLDLEGICASSGSACSAGSIKPSYVVEALGLEKALASSMIRFSLGRQSTIEEVESVGRVLPEVVRRAQTT